MRIMANIKEVFISTLTIGVYAHVASFVLVFCGVMLTVFERPDSHQRMSLLKVMWILRCESRITAALYLTMPSIRPWRSASKASQSGYMEALRIIY
jgi:hypothetical protein